MGEALGKLFVPLHSLPGLYDLPDQCVEPAFDPERHLDVTVGGLAQLAFLAAAYGFVLFQASNMIADGSELLLLIPEIAPIVGSVVIPILGAVPDGAVVLFSGLGQNAQKELSVGVGALAGSTIMLLTVPYFLSILAGRVNVVDGPRCTYTRQGSQDPNWRKLDDKPLSQMLSRSGVEADYGAVRSGAITMLLTAASYLIIQGAAFAFEGDASEAQVAKDEKSFALAGLILCAAFFAGYLFQQIRNSGDDKVLQDFIDRKREAALRSGMLSLQGAFMNALNEYTADDTHLLAGEHKRHRFEAIVRKFFNQYDLNGDSSIDRQELKLLLADLHIANTEENLQHFMQEMDSDGNESIHFHEFLDCMLRLIGGQVSTHGGVASYGATGRTNSNGRSVVPSASTERIDQLMHHHETAGDQVRERIDAEQSALREVIHSDSQRNLARGHSSEGPQPGQEDVFGAAGGDGDEEEEEEDVPEDLADLPPDQQRRRVLLRSVRLMLTGTALVLLFSDPMVDVMGEIGNVCGIPPFYVSFILAPLASNASELVASYNYALKKTSKTITISLTSLTGAAIMNNTFCLGIFLALVYFRGLAWEFSAETISILFVEACVAFIAIRNRVQTVKQGLFVLSLLPISLVIVFVLENVFGLD